MKLLIGGSPCTHWSIAQTKNRETEASGIGWELFLNYRIARDKYQPDYFLYENNKSMSPAIRAQITAELGVEPVLINSALVSAQNRQRLYWAGKRNPDVHTGKCRSSCRRTEASCFGTFWRLASRCARKATRFKQDTALRRKTLLHAGSGTPWRSLLPLSR